MNRLFPLAVLALCSASVFAQSASDEDASSAQERKRIQDARARAESDFTAAQKACYQKFVVTGCIDDARARRRETMADLKRQEIALDEQERKRKAAERQRDLEQRDQQARDRQDKAAAEAAKQQGREQQAAEKAATRASDAASAPARAVQRNKQVQEREAAKAADRQQKTQDAGKRVAEQDKKVREAEAHRAEVERRNADRKKPEAPPLPVPP